MSTYPVPVLVGLAKPWEGIDQEIGEASEALTVTRFFQTRTDHQAGDVLTVEIRNAAGDFIALTLGDGVQSGAAVGSVAFAAGEKILRRVVSSGTTSMNLGGSFEVNGGSLAAGPYLTTVAAVKEYLKIDHANADLDTIIESQVAWVSRALQQEIGFEVIEATFTDDLDVMGWEDTLILSQEPVTAIQEVTEGDDVVPAGEYRIRDRRGLLRVGDGTNIRRTWRGGLTRVTFTAGYATVPADLAGVATVEAALATKQTEHKGGLLGLSAKTFPGQTDAQAREWDWQAPTRRVIATHRRLM